MKLRDYILSMCGMLFVLLIGAGVVEKTQTVKPAIPKQVFAKNYDGRDREAFEDIKRMQSEGWVLKQFVIGSQYGSIVYVFMEKY